MRRLTIAPMLPGEGSAKSPEFQTAESVESGGTAAATQILRSAGLLGGVEQHIAVPGTSDGIRTVLAFAGAESARRSLPVLARGEPGSTTTLFPVSGIPGAIGSEIVTATVLGRNIVFAAGPYAYIVGVATTPGSNHAPSRSAMIAAASAWYAKLQLLT
jgi:hypothetical protein